MTNCTIGAMDGQEKPLRIFVPVQVRWAASGYLLGCYDPEARICCVTAIIHADNSQISQLLASMGASHSVETSVLGCLENLSAKGSLSLDEAAKQDDKIVWLSLKNRNWELTRVQFTCTRKAEVDQGSFVIYYDPASLKKSAFLCDPVCKLRRADSTQAFKAVTTNIDFLLLSLNLYDDLNMEMSRSGVEVTPSPRLPLIRMPLVPTCITKVVGSGVASCLKSSRLPFIGNALNQWKICNKPAFLCHLDRRWTTLKGAVRDASGTPCEKLRFENTGTQLLFDILIGIIVMIYMLQTDYHILVAEHIMSSADWIASELQVLLKWMMGFPAGLKLNSQLDSFLGRFFLYHIYLWTGYLQVLRPILSTFLWYICASGCLGVTTQLCLIQDLISMMTLHIYCFYVYAARLYYLQMCGLASLWRLFRGKKWNVLRKRVDSTSFDVDQLFLGTLLFTILLFLLPTTALYYIVFTALRLLVLLIQELLHKIVSIFNLLPLQSMAYRVLSPSNVSDSVFFTVRHKYSPNVPLSIEMQLVPASLSKIWQHSTSIGLHQSYSWKNLGHKLYWGRLIYPWIESGN